MQRTTTVLAGTLILGVLSVIIIASTTSGPMQALTMGFGALFGLCSVAFTQHLNTLAALTTSQKARLQEARGLARALASEIGVFGHVLLAKGHTLNLHLGNGSDGNEDDGTNPDDLLRFIELPSRVIFDASAGKIALLEVIEEYGEFQPKEEKLVERVVGFYEGVMDLRSGVSSAKLQNRLMTAEEVRRVQERLRSNAQFALNLSERLHEFIGFSESTTLAASAGQGRRQMATQQVATNVATSNGPSLAESDEVQR